jgi:hypothetical protein
MEVLGGMLPRGAVAAAYVTAAQAQPEVNPTPTGLQALLTARRRMWLDLVELCDMRTALGHGIPRYVTVRVQILLQVTPEQVNGGPTALTNQDNLIY